MKSTHEIHYAFSKSVPDIEFDDKGTCVFPSKYHGELTLSEKKWDTICRAPERSYYKFNGEKIATTLINPDIVRYHRQEKQQLLYYKKFTRLRYNEDGVEFNFQTGIYFAVVIDTTTSRICTVYPVEDPKPGKAFVPKK